jgi:hypothetical protein
MDLDYAWVPYFYKKIKVSEDGIPSSIEELKSFAKDWAVETKNPKLTGLDLLLRNLGFSKL